ncbi:hypothetical protein PF010_g18104 [Phytophthora fragariae]|uniref:Uncharacterized protein n=1 Tax=Phytophthora fragariae TaxID=53985 RepID=A0A6A3JES3_9STRA|nr:hypothetical protein PF011_g17724 [Phytophthora fragariae]KAE9091678.1 hypothetical protein PF010_g18104 [Phytophthora fragariae]KAE9203809.1 hypothetical protein PF004_g18035 [Phytophthora fragariae]
MSSTEDQASNSDDITFPPSQSSVPSVNLASTGDQEDSSGPPPNSSNDDDDDDDSDDFKRRQEEDLNYRRTHGTCMFYPTNDRHPCQMQRSCYDCLNFNITTEPEGCFVNPMGQCVSSSKYDPAMDFRLGEPSNDLAAEFVTAGYNGTTGNGSEPTAESRYDEDQQFDFPAGNATYCENDDAQCLLCRATAFAEIIYHNSDNSRSRYCVGESGCVCVAICEALEINHRRPDKSCMINAMSMQEANVAVSQVGSIAAILGAMCFIVASVFVIYRIRKRGESFASDGEGNDQGMGNLQHNRRGGNDDDPVVTPADGASPIATATPVMRAESGSGLLLNLFGWTAMREVLVNKEQMQADGIEDLALEPVKNNNVQLIGALPSAPMADAEVPTAPPVMIPYATAVATAPMAITVRAMAAPSAPDFEDMDSIDGDDVDMAEL